MMRAGDRSFLDLIDAIYAAGVDSRLWPEALDRLAASFGGSQATLYSHDLRDRRADIHAHAGIEDDYRASYVAHFGAKNPFVAKIAQLAVGVVATADDLIHRDTYRRGEFFNDWVRPQACAEFVTTTISRNTAVLTGVTVLRGRRPFDGGELQRWRELMPHLRRASEVHMELRGARRAQDGALAALDRLSIAMLVVGTEADIVSANASAERLLGASLGLAVVDGILRCETLHATAALARTIRAAASSEAGPRPPAGAFLSVPSRTGRSLPVLVIPLEGDDLTLGMCRPVALVLIGAPRVLAADSGDLALAFGLTPMEAALLSALVDGSSVSDLAARRGVALHTAKSQLRQVLGKMGAHRQIDAIRMVLNDSVLARPAVADGSEP